MVLRLIIGFILIVLTYAVNAQQDSILLEAVTVYGLPEEKYLTGSSVHSLDSSVLRQQSNRHLGDALAEQLPIYFRNYGSGMISGISLRGTSPSHTAVLWNGININSFSHGQADFSILPSDAFGEVKVHTGGGSARFGSGAFGGTILLNSTSTEENAFSISQHVASFGKYFTSLKNSSVIGKWRLATKFYHLVSENNFKILATGERQQHAWYRQWGVLQNVSYHWSAAKSLSVHYWYHDADREIQPAIGQHNSTDQQQDRNHRLGIQYRSAARSGLFSATGGYVNDVIVFNGGKSTVYRWITALRHEVTLGKLFTLQAGAEWNHIVGKIPEYQNGKAEEDRFDFIASVQKNIQDRLGLVLNLRQPVVTGFSAPFLPYLGVDYALIKSSNHDFHIRGNISKNYRIPTLNDRYWQRAGSKELLPEISIASEIGWRWRLGNINIDNTWFNQDIDQWIQWVPREDGQYIPRNVKKIRAQGFEARLSSKKKIDKVILVPTANYSFTKSVTTEAPPAEEATIGKQLIYTPVHAATGFLKVQWRDFYFNAGAQYSGKRYVDFSNSEIYALPSYVLVNFSGGRSWLIKNHQIDVNIGVANISNKDYQQYSGRAMPGRNYNVRINYQLNYKSK
jgi:vitamin B12 transporter